MNSAPKTGGSTDASLSYTFQGEGERGRELLTDAKEKSRGVLRADGYFRANFRSQVKVVPEDQEPVDGGFSERRERETSRETGHSPAQSRAMYTRRSTVYFRTLSDESLRLLDLND